MARLQIYLTKSAVNTKLLSRVISADSRAVKPRYPGLHNLDAKNIMAQQRGGLYDNKDFHKLQVDTSLIGRDRGIEGAATSKLPQRTAVLDNSTNAVATSGRHGDPHLIMTKEPEYNPPDNIKFNKHTAYKGYRQFQGAEFKPTTTVPNQHDISYASPYMHVADGYAAKGGNTGLTRKERYSFPQYIDKINTRAIPEAGKGPITNFFGHTSKYLTETHPNTLSLSPKDKIKTLQDSVAYMDKLDKRSVRPRMNDKTFYEMQLNTQDMHKAITHRYKQLPEGLGYQQVQGNKNKRKYEYKS